MRQPRQLPPLVERAWVSVDTEGSGLFPDDGARISTVSAAWMHTACAGPCEGWDAEEWPGVGVIHSAAFPFGQGPEDDGALFSMCENLGRAAYEEFLVWLVGHSEPNWRDGAVEKGNRLVMQNGQYDTIMFDHNPKGIDGGIGGGTDLLPYFRWDTMLAEKELFPKGSASLEAMGKRYFGRGKAAFKPPGTKAEPRYDLALWEDIKEYAREDAALTLAIAMRQMEKAEEYGTVGLIDRRKRYLDYAVRAERRGLPYDSAGSLAVVPELAAKQRHHARLLPFAPPTGNTAKAFFFGEDVSVRGVRGLGLTPLSISERTGVASLDAVTVRTFAEDGVEGAYSWWAHETLKRVSAMYYRGWAEKVGADGRLRARIKTLGTVSDRSSIERANLQAMPHEDKLDAELLAGIPTPRKFIERGIALENLRGWEFDLSQAELRVGALLADCKPMLTAYDQGADLHNLTAELIGCERTPAKMSNFLLLFGGGAATFQTQIKKKAWLDLPYSECKKIVDGWRYAYPEFCGRRGDGGAVDRWERYAKRTGWVPIHQGMPRYMRPYEDTRKAWNQRVQGSIANFMIDMVPVVEDAVEELGGELVMTVHDSMIVLGPAQIEDQLIKKVLKVGKDMWHQEFGMPGGLDVKRFEVTR